MFLLSLSLAEHALKFYGLPPGCTVRLINISENATYEINTIEGQRFALRIHRQHYHSKVAIASELAWLIDLRQSEIVITPKPVAGLNGQFIQDALGRHVVLFEWEQGIEPTIHHNLEGPFEILGEQTARMHMHAKQWQRPKSFERFTWDFETSLGENNPHWGKWRDGLGVDAAHAALFARAVDLIGIRLGHYGKHKNRFGLIHADLRMANLLVDGTAVKVIDFDDCGFGWFMYDAVTPVSFYEHARQVPALLDAWKTGYRRVADLAKEDENEIATFMMLRRLLLVAWIGSHSETNLAKSMGVDYTYGTADLCENYLKEFG